MRVLAASLTLPPPPLPHTCFSCCYGFFKVTTTSHDSRVKTPPGMPLDRIQKKKEKQLSDGAAAFSLLLIVLLLIYYYCCHDYFLSPPTLRSVGRFLDRSSLVAPSCILSSSVRFIFSLCFQHLLKVTRGNNSNPPPTVNKRRSRSCKTNRLQGRKKKKKVQMNNTGE